MNKINKKPTLSQDVFVIGFIIIGFLLLIAFFYYNSMKDYAMLIDDIQPLFNNYEREIPSDLIPLSQGIKVSYILWLYFENNSENANWFSNFSSDKNILIKDYGPDIVYQPYTNSIKVLVKVKDIRQPIVSDEENPDKDNVYSDMDNKNIDFKEKVQEIEVKGITLQKWIQLVVTIDNRYVDIYLDTVLTKSALLDNVPILNNTDIIIGKPRNNPNCYLGQLQYKPDLISLSEINGLYFKDSNKFTITHNIKNKVSLETVEIRKKEYEKKILDEEIDRLNREDPL